jgi:hypothetical protein
VEAAALVGPPEVAFEKVRHRVLFLVLLYPTPLPPGRISGGSGLFCLAWTPLGGSKRKIPKGLLLRSSIHWVYWRARTGKPRAGARGFSVFSTVMSITRTSRVFVVSC